MNSRLILDQALEKLKLTSFLPAQEEAITGIYAAGTRGRSCIYYPTGRGKTITALVSMYYLGAEKVTVIAPPLTHAAWQKEADALGIEVTLMSHEKFRMKDTRLSRTEAIICDEFHLLGGRTAVGWKKFDRLAAHLEAPIIILSATPQYNDAQRVYCILHVLHPEECRGGYEAFLYKHCILKQSFVGLPDVVGFHLYENSEEFLSVMDDVYYIPDEAVYDIVDQKFERPMPKEWDQYGYDSRTELLMHSLMTQRISKQYFQILEEEGNILRLREQLLYWLEMLIASEPTHTLIFCEHETIARHVFDALDSPNVFLITGSMTKKKKDEILQEFLETDTKKVLIGTATLVTGTDGIDKVSNQLILFQDTPDDSLRRQLVGRILPRGTSDNYDDKKFYRAVYGT